jgi:hypothetical protein
MKAYSVSGKDLINPKKNPHFHLSARKIIKNQAIRKHEIIDSKKFAFFQGPDPSRTLQKKMGERLKEKGTFKNYRVVKRANGYLLYVR